MPPPGAEEVELTAWVEEHVPDLAGKVAKVTTGPLPTGSKTMMSMTGDLEFVLEENPEAQITLEVLFFEIVVGVVSGCFLVCLDSLCPGCSLRPGNLADIHVDIHGRVA